MARAFSLSFALPFAALLLAAPLASAGCTADARVASVAQRWLALEPQLALDDLDVTTGRCFRQQLMATLAESLGPVVGYKVGVYTPAARNTYRTDAPVLGVLRERMLVAEGTPIAVSAGVALVSEADFVLVVRDEGINAATSREEAYRHLRGFRPFIELPDLNYRGEVPPRLGQLIALDVNARLGVVGAELPLPDFEALAALSADVERTAGAERSTAKGIARETLGDPVQIVLAARDALRAEGGRLEAGDLVSIGTLTPPRPVRAGETLRVRYQLAARSAMIEVRFVP
jgi:2-keto-4-pentenoate hydratase